MQQTTKAGLIDQIKAKLNPRPRDSGLHIFFDFQREKDNVMLFRLSGRPDIVEADKLMTESECISLLKRLKPEVYRLGRYHFIIPASRRQRELE